MIVKDRLLLLKLLLKAVFFLTAIGIIIWQSQEEKNEQPIVKNEAKEEIKDWGDILMKPILALCPIPVAKEVCMLHGIIMYGTTNLSIKNTGITRIQYRL